MNKFIIALMISAVSFGSLASTKVSMKNNNVRVQQNGITTNYGKVRLVKERNGNIEIMTNKNFSTPAITIHRNGNITTQRSNNSASFTCRYDCDIEMEE